jgi:3'-5' exoribonuclease
MDIKLWNSPLAAFPHKVGDILLMDVVVEEYQGKTTGKLDGTSPYDASQINQSDFFKASEFNPGEMWAAFAKFLDGFHHPHFQNVAKDLFDSDSVVAFSEAPAATRLHHSFKYGLLEHTLQMLQCSEVLLDLPMFHELNKDLCMFGIMFHDFGKIYEYSTEPGFKKRLQGLLVPHIPMVAARIYESANKFGVPEMVRDHMMHVVLAHHRFLEWGSPVGFGCPEASFVHNVDNLHGGTFGLLQARAEGKEESVKYGFGSDQATILKKSFTEILKETEGVEGGF